MISDTVFKDALEVAYKAIGMTKAQRNAFIYIDMNSPIHQRDHILEIAENKAREHQSAKKASKKVRSEFEEQAALVHWFRKTYPDVWIYANRNGGTRSPREKVDQIREGVLAGVADLFAPGFKLYIEMKRTKGGVTSDAQIAFKEHVKQFGYSWILAEGFEDAKEKILIFIDGDKNKT
ncbi:MAG: hypothetical protein WC622_16560 [Pedobacter sp.]|jgi:hypothetical protein|uniref:hypothetical protein n=1 Tax=Pedobacter sp. TaxID=1411316 RepID=UPI00356A1C8C